MLSRFSPLLATRMALYLFLKPLPFPIPGREKELRERSIAHRLLTKSGAPFTVFEIGTGEEIVLMIHGWSGRGSQFFKLAQKLQNDYRLLLIEAPGHGAHLGKRTHMLAFVEAIEATEQALGKAKFAVGHSLGGMALFNALEQGSSFQKLVIAGTPANVRNVTSDFCLKVAANERVAEGLLSHIQKRFAVLPEAVSTDFLAQKHNPLGLIVHDEADADVPVENAYRSADHWGRAELMITRGLGHRKILMDEIVLQRIYAFFKN